MNLLKRLEMKYFWTTWPIKDSLNVKKSKCWMQIKISLPPKLTSSQDASQWLTGWKAHTEKFVANRGAVTPIKQLCDPSHYTVSLLSSTDFDYSVILHPSILWYYKNEQQMWHILNRRCSQFLVFFFVFFNHTFWGKFMVSFNLYLQSNQLKRFSFPKTNSYIANFAWSLPLQPNHLAIEINKPLLDNSIVIFLLEGPATNSLLTYMRQISPVVKWYSVCPENGALWVHFIVW